MSLPSPIDARCRGLLLTLQRRARTVAGSIAAVSAAYLAGCGGDGPPSGPRDGGVTSVQVHASLAASSIRTLTIMVTGPGIHVPVVKNVGVPDGAASAELSMEVPVGGGRTFVARGQDASGEFTHEGTTTVTIRPGVATVPITMYPLLGDVPISVGVGAYFVTVAPSSIPPLAPGAEVPLQAIVRDEKSHAVPGANVLWGSLDPTVATVEGGILRAYAPGVTWIYASYRGAVWSLGVTVDGAVSGFREISAGSQHSCAIDRRGFAWCWGANELGQLGDGTRTSRSVPVAVAAGLRFASLSTGDTHTCGVTIDGGAYCWGFNGHGQLGSSTSSGGPLASTPQRVRGSQAWASVHAGTVATCGITRSGEGWCWGRGDDGNVGLAGPSAPPDAIIWPEPRLVTEAAGPWRSFDVASMLSCGVTTDGDVICTQDAPSLVTTASTFGDLWQTFQLGDRTYSGTPPSAVTYTVDLPFACGLTVGGWITCWGNGMFGELGMGVAVVDYATSHGTVHGPQGYKALGVGARFACGLRDGGEVRCWGRNNFRQIGDGTLVDRLVPTPVAGSHVFTRLAVGQTHVCALRADGAAYCWGGNDWGQLGDGHVFPSSTPVAVVLPAGVAP